MSDKYFKNKLCLHVASTKFSSTIFAASESDTLVYTARTDVRTTCSLFIRMTSYRTRRLLVLSRNRPICDIVIIA